MMGMRECEWVRVQCSETKWAASTHLVIVQRYLYLLGLLRECCSHGLLQCLNAGRVEK